MLFKLLRVQGELAELRERFPEWYIDVQFGPDTLMYVAARGVITVVAWSPAQLGASMREAEAVTLAWDDVPIAGPREHRGRYGRDWKYGLSLTGPDCPMMPRKFTLRHLTLPCFRTSAGWRADFSAKIVLSLIRRPDCPAEGTPAPVTTNRWTFVNVGKAWQRQMREQIEAAERQSGHPYWESYNLDIAAATVQPIDTKTAREVIEQYEWLGKMPAVVWYRFGLYFGDALGGVVTYGPDYGENLGVWDRYGYTGKIILLSRGACAHWAHEHSASKLIRGSMRMLPRRFEITTATVDTDAGEVGTIYQASGFEYAEMGTHSRNGAIINGKSYTSRGLRQTFGYSSLARLRTEFGADAVTPLPEKAKGRYFAFRGGKVARKRNRAAIAHLIKPCPRRDGQTAPAAVYEGRQEAA